MELNELGKYPISDVLPYGTDARYEPEYDELQLEIDKLSNATAGGAVDWNHVVQLGICILQDKSKDLKVATYLAVGLCQINGVTGVKEGTRLLCDLVTTYWDDLFPAKKRMRARTSAVTWWSEKIKKYLQEYDGEALPEQTVTELVEVIKAFDSELASKSDDAPILRHLAELAQHLPMIVENAQFELPQDEKTATDDLPAPKMISSSSTRSKATKSQVSSMPQVIPQVFTGAIEDDETCQKALTQSLDTLVSVADHQLINDVRNPNGYRFRRLATWIKITMIPPAENNITLISPPDSSIKSSITHLLARSEFASAIQVSEYRVGEFIFWLDLSYITAMALGHMGAATAQQTVESETVLLVKRIPGIQKLAFSDGTPFADAKTKKWLNDLTSKGNTAEVHTGVHEGVLADVQKKIAQMDKNNKSIEGSKLIQHAMAVSSSIREKFLLRLELIKLLVSEGQTKLAIVHIEDLLKQIDTYSLDLWEPDLALSAYISAYKIRVVETDSDSSRLASDILSKISRQWPASALSLLDD